MPTTLEAIIYVAAVNSLLVTSLRTIFNNWNPQGPFLRLYKTDVRGTGLSYNKRVQMKTYNSI